MNEPLTRWVAEIGKNHNGSLDRALNLIDVAAGIGCWGVKFQAFGSWSDLYAPPFDRGHTYRATLPSGWKERLIGRAHERGIKFGLTPFGTNALLSWGGIAVDFFKISSYQLLDLGFITAVARFKRPLVISTGMATLEEIEAAVDAAKRGGVERLTLLHCVSAYPTPMEQANLRKIQSLREQFPGAKIGWSAHTQNALVVMNVFHFKPDMIEFHMDLDMGGLEYPGEHCFLPMEAEAMIHGRIECPSGWENDAVRGAGEIFPQECEKPEIEWRHDPEDGLRPRKAKREPA